MSLGLTDLSSLPPEIGLFSELSELNLAANDLSSLPPEIGKLIKLKILNLSGNNLTNLPSEICRITPDQLDLSSNRLKVNNLSDDVITWANKYDSDWRYTQSTDIIANPKINDPNILTYNPITNLLQFSISTKNPLMIKIFNAQGRIINELEHPMTPGLNCINVLEVIPSSGAFYLKLSNLDVSLGSKIILGK